MLALRRPLVAITLMKPVGISLTVTGTDVTANDRVTPLYANDRTTPARGNE